MKCKLLILTSLCLFVNLDVTAQNAGNAQPVNYPTVYSPQVEAMMRYDYATVNLNTGTISQTIPLVEFEDPDFDLDISITYSMDGFKPLTPDNYVGMGWRLNCIGVITREVHGIPDEFRCFPAAPTYGNGYSGVSISGYGFQNSSTASLLLTSPVSYLESSLKEVPVGTNGKVKTIARSTGNSWIEQAPDLFRFSFGKHSGSFMLDGKNVLVSSDTGCNYKVEITNFNKNNDNRNSTQNTTEITITTDDGYKYIFGGRYSAIEYTALRWTTSIADLNQQMTIGDPDRYNEITAYYLTKVIAPNGREMIFDYTCTIPEDIYSNPEILILDRPYTSAGEDYKKYYTVIPNLIANSTFSAAQNVNSLHLSYTVNKTALLNSISAGDKRIMFEYSNHPSPFFTRASEVNNIFYDFISGCGCRLDSVTSKVYSTSAIIEDTYLSYNTFDARLKLTGVANSKRGRYRFNYYSSDFYDSITLDLDKWGYWDGRDSNTSFKPEPTSQMNHDIREYHKAEGDKNREPKGKAYNANMLSEVIFPTGGRKSFIYEPHRYSKYYYQGYDNKYIPCMRTTSSNGEIAGGARIRKEIFHDNDDASESRMKIYDYSLENGKSSGILKREGDNYMGFYVMNYFLDMSSLNPVKLYAENEYQLNYSPYTSGYNMLRRNGIGDYIEYTRVTEYDYISTNHTSSDSYLNDISLPRKVSVFSETPLIYESRGFKQITRQLIGSCNTYKTNAKTFLYNYFSIPVDYSRKGGKLLSETYYTAGGNIKCHTDYDYIEISRGNGAYINIYPGFDGSDVGMYSQVVRVPHYSMLKSKVTTDEYDLNGNVSSYTQQYNYDSVGQLKSYVITDKSGHSTTTEYTYPKDYSGDNVYSTMIGLNMLKPIITTTVTADSTEIVYRSRTDYSLLSSSDSQAASRTIPVISATSETLGVGDMETKAEYLSYDKYGNPLWIKSYGRNTTYIWGYEGRYLLYIIVNATPSDINNVLPDDIEAISMMETPPDNIDSVLRNTLSDAFITSYTYIPYIGLSSETSPDGTTIYYEYDERNRLSSKYYMDGTEKSIIEKYEYKFANE